MKRIFYFNLLIAGLILSACSKSDNIEPIDTNKNEDSTIYKLPVVQTLEITDILPASAVSGGILIDDGGTDILNKGLCYKKEGLPTVGDELATIVSFDTSGKFICELSNLTDSSYYYIRTFAENSVGIAYGELKSFFTPSGTLPEVETNENFVSTSSLIIGSGNVLSEGGGNVLSKGLCYSKNPNPTIDDDYTVDGDGVGGFYSKIENLDVSTTYYIRAYAKSEYAVGYGEQYTIKTKSKGNFTYTIHCTITGADEHYTRIEKAMENAVYYYNNFTAITKHINVYYNPDVATADGNINGTIRFGSNASYQATGTALHEISHTVGVGTHWRWNSTDEFIKGGKYQKVNANRVLQVMTHNPDAGISGDSMHFWPYGINGAHEDTGQDELYMIHSLVVQGMHDDGLPSQ